MQGTKGAPLWVKSDAGRASSRRPRQTNDCTVIALALARRLSYDDAYDQLRAAGRQSGRRFNFRPWIEAQGWARRIAFPAVKGRPRMTPVRFVQDFPKGYYILRTAHHAIACIDGVLYDQVAVRESMCVYAAWEVTRDADDTSATVSHQEGLA